MKLACMAGVLPYGVADVIWRLAVVPASSIAMCLIAFRCLGFALPALISVLRVRLHTWLWPLAAPGCRALAGCGGQGVDPDDRRMAVRCFIVFSSTTVLWLAIGGALGEHWGYVQLAVLQIHAFRDRL